MSNLERQRRFRKSHPGYFNRYKHRPTPAQVQAITRDILAKANANSPIAPPTVPPADPIVTETT